MSRIFRCYIEYRKGTSPYDVFKGPRRKGKVTWLTMPTRDEAVTYMGEHMVKARKGEFVDRIVATGWKDDRAMREMGVKELPLVFTEDG